MGLLDELQKRIYHGKENAVEGRESGEEGLTGEQVQKELIAPTMSRVHHYLRGLVRILNSEQPVITSGFRIPGLGTIEEMQQGNYTLIFNTTPDAETISLRYQLLRGQPAEFVAEDDERIGALVEQMRQHGLVPELLESGRVRVESTIPVQIEFSSERQRGNLVLNIRNHESMGVNAYQLRPELVTDALLEELERYVRRQDNDFLDELTMAQHPTQIGESSAEITGGYQDLPSRTQELSSARLGILGAQQPKLSLSYYDVIKEVSASTGGFVIGRGEQADLMVGAAFASRKHLVIVFRNGKFVLVDKSTNGTFVKPQGGEEVYLQQEELPLSGSGLISLGKSISVSNEHLIYYFCH